MAFVVRLAAVIVFLASFAYARGYNGFFTPELVRGREAPFIPVSTTAIIEIGDRLSGELRFRDLGTYRLEGAVTGRRLEITLLASDGRVAGRGDGVLDGTRLEAALTLLEPDGATSARGNLTLEAAAEWRASLATRKNVRDRAKRPWFLPEFDDSDWEVVGLPDDSSFGDKLKYSRYYRSRFTLPDVAESLSAVFSSDDGIWIFVNGRYLGHWGAGENKGGCVNDPRDRCAIDGVVPPVVIPPEFLRAGENVIAARVNNGVCCFSYFNLLVTRVRARLLPDAPPR